MSRASAVLRAAHATDRFALNIACRAASSSTQLIFGLSFSLVLTARVVCCLHADRQENMIRARSPIQKEAKVLLKGHVSATRQCGFAGSNQEIGLVQPREGRRPFIQSLDHVILLYRWPFKQRQGGPQ